MSEDSIERDGIKWGAEIAVDGKRPEWLQLEQLCMAQSNFTGEWYQNSKAQPAIEWGFSAIRAIRLPADHPYYAQQKADEAFAAKLLDADVRGVMRRRERQEDAATIAINPALVERMVALVRSAANGEHISAARAKSIIGEIDPGTMLKERFQHANPLWHLMDRAELIERVLAWKETNA